MGGVAVLATLVNLPAIVPAIKHGGFNADDWFLQATARFGGKAFGSNPVGGHPGLIGSFGALHPLFADRPAALVYYAPLHSIFGVHMKVYMGVCALLAVALAPLVFAVLRNLAVPPVHAAAIGVLASLFPYADATRFWSSGSESLLSVLLFLGGLSIGLYAFRQSDRRASRRRTYVLHAISLGLYVLSVLTNQITIGLIVGAGLLYMCVADWRSAARRWAFDAPICVALVAYFAHFSGKPKATPGLARIEFIYGHALYVVSGSIDPFRGLASERGLLVIALLVAASLVTCWCLPMADQLRRNLLRWLGIAAAAAVWMVTV